MGKVGDLILESESSEHVPNNSLRFEFEEQVKWFKFGLDLLEGLQSQFSLLCSNLKR